MNFITHAWKHRAWYVKPQTSVLVQEHHDNFPTNKNDEVLLMIHIFVHIFIKKKEML